ncbi:type II toxin-antitoxin system RelE/ParE family toxin [Leptospira bandrabouensis]|uniref:type II toxin-antitoxin system RelE/ParE family toxin n=1 Tax=Leptospira bandrabouensis TaxID=2484903 RepID=UPI001EE7A75F|nr:type II toxin-antitoxin system RelE/ParE family toxin [Leptospira bandrabouensis]MCG6161915.1 type II toxin-antitoxin system RelE/ParE family toxin [Leptospira bandrabouensis]MCG6166120.1 type II toxin-antitoxin system RelE/ParE family toxin [Leptospira bandrabouensis]
MWEIESTEEFDNWLRKLDLNSKEEILAHFYLLRQKGPLLGRPFADSIQGSKIKNLKELRIQVKLKVIRIFFVFTEGRIGLLLAGGDKRGNDKRFYEEMIPMVEKIYKNWLIKNGKDSDESKSKKKSNRKS